MNTRNLLLLFALLALLLAGCAPTGDDLPAPQEQDGVTQGAGEEEASTGDTTDVSVSDATDTSDVSDAPDSPSANPFIAIAGGTFQMGSTTGDSSEQPIHQVTVSAFRLQKYEVTAGQYQACVDAGVCTRSSTRSGDYYTYNRVGYEDHPINDVNWYEAQNYCQWLGGDLPTEAQWEFAARGTAGRTYPWGETVPSATANNLANCNESDCHDGYQYTAPVGSFPNGATPEGLNDLAGNLWEWTADWYGSYSSSAVVDPTGPASGAGRVLRGGSWGDFAGIIRSARRGPYNPDSWNYNFGNPGLRHNLIGFRCAFPAQ